MLNRSKFKKPSVSAANKPPLNRNSIIVEQDEDSYEVAMTVTEPLQKKKQIMKIPESVGSPQNESDNYSEATSIRSKRISQLINKKQSPRNSVLSSEQHEIEIGDPSPSTKSTKLSSVSGKRNMSFRASVALSSIQNQLGN